MSRFFILFAALGLAQAAPARAMTEPAPAAEPPAETAAAPRPDSRQLEADLQRLPWPRFRTVVEGIPKLKSSIDAYGPAGWQFVQANYRTYPWKKNIDKLGEDQRRHLADLIQSAKAGR